MKVVLFTRRNVGMYCLSYLVALGHEVSLVSDDKNVLWLGERLGCKTTTMEEIEDYGLLVSIHWHKIIPEMYLKQNQAINIHPCLYLYPGKNPISQYIENKDKKGSVESHYMIKEVDAGEVIHQEFFPTPICNDFASFYNIALPFYFKNLDATLNKIINA